MILKCKMGSISGILDISNISLEGKRIVKAFRTQMTVFDYAGRKVSINPKTGKKMFSKPEPLSVFFVMHKQKVYLPNGPLQLLCNNLENIGIHIEYSKMDTYEPDAIDIKFKDGITLYDRQNACISKIEESGNTTGLIGLDPGSGKALADSTIVPIPGGFVYHGNLEVGDEVLGSNGEPTKILEVFKHSRLPVYEMEFSDGTSIDCCRDHLWTVIDAEVENIPDGAMSESLKVDVLTTKQILDKGLLTKHSKWEINSEVSDQYHYSHRFSIPNHNGVKHNISNRQKNYDEIIKELGESFASSDLAFVNKFLMLARSLGYIYSVDVDTCGNGETCWLVDKMKAPRGKQIISITKTTRVEDMTCITIDAPDRTYMVSKAFTLTHNTFTALAYASKVKKRVMVFSKASYLVQWKKEITDVVEVGEMSFVKSTDGLLKLLNKAKEGCIPDIILLSLATYRSYVKRWIGNDERITIPPTELASILKLGTVLCDETHSELPALWALLTFTNVPLLLGLSGTMSSSDPFIKSIMVWMFPPESSYYENSTDGYIDLIHYYYRLEYPKNVITSHRGRNTYSHVAFEKWILKSPLLVRRYCNLIDDVFTKVHLDRCKPGDKCLIFVSMVKLAEEVVKYLRRKHSDRTLSMINFTGAVTKDDVLKVDVMVSTIGKSGTAMDHAGLTTLINTVAVFKKETAVQNIQRLRRPKNKRLERYNNYMDDVQRVCVQFVCSDIQAHMYFTRNRLAAIRRVTSKVIDVETTYFV